MAAIPFCYLSERKGDIILKQNKKMIVCFLTPALFFFVVMYLYPIIRTVIMSFFNVEGVSDPMSEWSFNGLGNYQKLIETQLFRTSMMNMLKIFIIGGIAVMVIALLFAVILTSGVRLKSFWRAVIYVPNIINAVAIATMWIQYVFNKRFGLLHSFFTALGLEDLASIDYMNGKWKFWSLLIAFCFGSVGYFMLIFISGIERIPTDYYEAATIDGANKFQQFTGPSRLSDSSYGLRCGLRRSRLTMRRSLRLSICTTRYSAPQEVRPVTQAWALPLVF